MILLNKSLLNGNEEIKVARDIKPVLYDQDNMVDVNYAVFTKDKKSLKTVEKKELHKMQYPFDTELKLICQQIGFKLVNKLNWMIDKEVNFKRWNVIWVVQK